MSSSICNVRHYKHDSRVCLFIRFFCFFFAVIGVLYYCPFPSGVMIEKDVVCSCLHKGFHLLILRRNVRRLPCRGRGWYEDTRDSWKFRKWPISAYTSASLECGGWNQSLLTYFTLKYSGFRGPLKSNLERTNLRKKLNYFELEIVPLKSEVEVKQGRAVSKHEYWF